VAVGETVTAEARVTAEEGRRVEVEVTVERGGAAVFTGAFRCAVPARHVLERAGEGDGCST
jgi:predicted thioesterase